MGQFKVIKGSKMGQRSNFQNASIELNLIKNDPYDILSILKVLTYIRGH